MIKSLVRETILECGNEYNFDGSEMIRKMNLEDVEVVVVSKNSKNSKNLKNEKNLKKVKEIVGVKSRIPMPFNGLVRDECCKALRANHGLYTQCESVVCDSEFCNKCGPSAIYGTINQRLSVGIMEYREWTCQNLNHSNLSSLVKKCYYFQLDDQNQNR